MSSSQYYAIVNDVEALLAAQDQTCAGDTCPVARLSGCIIRMAGHDFMDYLPTAAPGQTGGSDGCVDFEDGDNAGLNECLAYGTNLGAIYSKYCSWLSLADFIVLAAEAVMILKSQCNPVYYDSTRVPPNCSTTDCSDLQYAVSYSVPFCSAGTLDRTYMAAHFKYGRVTSSTCSWALGRLPQPGNGCAANEETFVNRMGLTWEEVTAMMGVHTIGSASINASGYDGWWSDLVNSSYFNNNYYVSMLAKGWAPRLAVNGNPAKNQWTRVDNGQFSNTQMMLDTDLCLAFDLLNASTNSYTALLSATADCCAWVTTGALTGCRSGNYVAGAPMQCWDEVLPQDDHVCGTRGACCSARSVRGLPNCGSIVQPMQAPAWNLLSKQPSGSSFTSYDQVKLYAANSTRWYQDFLLVWEKATSIGQGTLKCVDDLCPSTSTTTTATRTATNTATHTATTATTTVAAPTTTATVTTAAKATAAAATTAQHQQLPQGPPQPPGPRGQQR